MDTTKPTLFDALRPAWRIAKEYELKAFEYGPGARANKAMLRKVPIRAAANNDRYEVSHE